MGRGRRRRGARARSSQPSQEQDEEDMDMDSDQEDQDASPPPPQPSGSRSRQAGLPHEQEVDMSDPVIAGLRTSMDNLVQLVKDILPTCYDENKKSEVVNRLQACMVKLIKSEVNYIEGLKLVDKTAHRMANIEEDANDNAILGHCEQLKTTALDKITEHRNSLKDSVLMKHSNFARLLQEITAVQRTIDLKNSQDVESDEGEEDQPESSVIDFENDTQSSGEMIPITDPITKLPLTDPIRNKKCNHIYGKASILEMLKGGKKTRCPWVGCPNKHWIKSTHLAEDPELTLKVQKKIKEAQRARASQHQTNVENI